MNIYGLNIASSTDNPNGRGGIHPDHTFQYLPIPEGDMARNAPTYRELGFADVKHPDLSVHLDPEFETFTYGHVARFGDHCLWKMVEGDILFFYATLDLLPKKATKKVAWGVYILGYFTINRVVDTRKMSGDKIRRLEGFEKNAHLRRVEPGVELLVKGSADSRRYQHAIQLSDPRDNHRLHSDFRRQIKTVTGKPLVGKTWHRWLFHSQDRRLAKRLRRTK